MNEVKNTKVCLVSISLGSGGAERSVSILSRMLVGLGFEVSIVLLNNEIEYPYKGTIFNLGVLKTGKDNLFKRMMRFRAFRSFLKKEQFDVIIDHRSKNQYQREVFYKKYLYRQFKTIYVTHSSSVSLSLTEAPEKFAALCNSNVYNVAVSKFIESQLFEKYQIEHRVTIPNAYDEEWLQNNSGILPEVLLNKKYLLFYGRLEDEVKDLSFLLNAFEASKLFTDEIYLVIMGDGADREMLEAKAKALKSNTHIVFIGHHPAPQVIVKGAHAVCLTSFFEGFPMVLIEALALGVPVVSLDIDSGPSEIIKDGMNGLLVKERNIATFAKALIEIATNEERYQSMKANAGKSVQAYSMDEIAQHWKKLLTHE